MFKILTLLIVAIITMSNSGCNETSTAKLEQQKTEQNQKRLLNTQPPVQLEWSLERDQINKRTNLWNDPNKTAYLYVLSYGKILGYYVIKGKVSSVNSQITNPEQTVYRSGGGGSATLPSPAEDGSYGSNGDGIFSFLTDGTYLETNCEYILMDRPLNIKTPVEFVYEINLDK